jgi:hypothetical protein
MVKISKNSEAVFMNSLLDSKPGIKMKWQAMSVIPIDIKYLIEFFIIKRRRSLTVLLFGY